MELRVSFAPENCMKRSLFVAVIIITGCLPTTSDRIRQYTEDGVYLFGRGEFEGARDSFHEVLKLTPEDANIHYNIAQCYDRQGSLPLAEKAYHECLQRNANHAECRHALHVLLYRTGRQPLANQMIAEWLAAEPKLAAPYAEDGWRLRQENNLPEAQGRLHQALNIEPQNVRALTELGIVYEKLERPDRALVLYERVLTREPGQLEVQDRINALKSKKVKQPLPD